MAYSYMTKYSEYSAILDVNSSVDYWSDHAVDLAIESLDSFESEDWDLLHEYLEHKDADWQVKCAETMSEVMPDDGLPVLYTLLETTNRDVLEAVLDSMSAFEKAGADISLSGKQIEIVRQASEHDGFLGQLAKRFIK